MRKGKEGAVAGLGPLEDGIMRVLWGRESPGGKEIHAELSRARPIALTTVLTVLERLVRKGLVKKTKGASVYLYRPAFTKEEFASRVSREVLRAIFDISTSSAAASFVDMLASEDPEELNRLSRLIEKKKKEMRRKG